MNNLGGMSALKAWRLVLASLIGDTAVLIMVFVGFRVFYVKIPLVVILALMAVMVVVGCEYWKAGGVNGKIEAGKDVEAVVVNGL
jgi:hypothetical protein